MSWSRAALAWCLLAVVMIVNGALRERLLAPMAGELLAHQLSTLAACVWILVLVWPLRAWIGADGRRDELRLGAVWIVWTIAFELGFGHWVAGHACARLFADYDLAAGRLWTLVLLTTGSAPWLVGALARRDRRR